MNHLPEQSIKKTKLQTKEEKLDFVTHHIEKNNDDVYCCKLCAFESIHFTDIERHIKTQKHIKRKTKINETQEKKLIGNIKQINDGLSKISDDLTKIFDVDETNTNAKTSHKCKCGNYFSHRQSLYNHKKTCKELKHLEVISNLIQKINDLKQLI